VLQADGTINRFLDRYSENLRNWLLYLGAENSNHVLNKMLNKETTLLKINKEYVEYIQRFVKEKKDKILISDLLQDLYDEISIRLQDKNISCEIKVPQNCLLVNINKFLLFNLFFNLFNNAIKYNVERGKIHIVGSYENNGLVVSIIDTGIGIGEQEIPFIFNRFKKFRQSLQQDSFGLGLPIVKSIADFHKITIEVTSIKNSGSTFKLIFPSEMVEIQE
jgi:signal transduction histidine kinase